MFIVLVGSLPVLGADKGVSDSTRTFPLKGVTVLAKLTAFPQAGRIGSSLLLSLEDITATNAASLGDVLGSQAGVFTRDYGVGASLQTISCRGMSSEHTLVLLDGVPLNSVQTGVVDLRLMPLDLVQSVALSRGGNSASYGSSALGGVVEIGTQESDSLPYSRLSAGIGSFGAKRLSISSRFFAASDIGVAVGASTEYGSGGYPIIITQQGAPAQAVRGNNDYRTRHLFVKGNWKAREPLQASVTMSYLTTERGTPGFFLTPSTQGSARQADDQFLAVGTMRVNLSEHAGLSASASLQNSYERYVDTSGLYPSANYYRNIGMSFSPNLHYIALPSVALDAGFDLSDASANGNALQARKSREHIGAYILPEFHSPVDTTESGIWVRPSLRFDVYGSSVDAWSPRIGVVLRYGIPHAGSLGETHFTLHSAVGKDFRVPTFNELYYAGAGGFGNSLLNPERSVSFDVGLSLEHEFFGNQKFDVTYYSISTDNRITWLPTASSFVYSPVNIEKTHSTGLEAEVRWSSASRNVEVGGNYTLIDARKKSSSSPRDPSFDKQLLYVPLETGTVSIRVRLPIQRETVTGVLLWLRDSYIGERFTADDNSEALPAYDLLDGNVALELRALGCDLLLRYGVNNIADVSYEVMPRYPMPLRNQTLSISVTREY